MCVCVSDREDTVCGARGAVNYRIAVGEVGCVLPMGSV